MLTYSALANYFFKKERYMKEYSKNLSLNQVGVNYARQLIEKGKVNTD